MLYLHQIFREMVLALYDRSVLPILKQLGRLLLLNQDLEHGQYQHWNSDAEHREQSDC